MRYCTLFDSTYAPQGMALIASMIRWCRPFTLDVLALDDMAAGIVRSAGFQEVTVHRLADVEGLSNRPVTQMAVSMQWKHFCWAMNTVFTEYVQRQYRTGVLSLDADTFFFGNPDHVLEICRDCSVAAPPHNFPPYLEETVATRGKYNVGGVWFNHDRIGMEMAAWWADRVCEKCDESTCGDQLYWDVIANMAGSRFREFPVGFNAAPWMRHYHFHHLRTPDKNPTPHMTHKLSGASHELVHYHFHEFRVGSRRRMTWTSPESGRTYGLTNYDVGRDVLGTVYAPYVETVESIVEMIGAQA